ncbi:MAG TPA: carboxypeptidase regulatory-like domain-containing protein, partial [Longimicrobiales bacterium]
MSAALAGEAWRGVVSLGLAALCVAWAGAGVAAPAQRQLHDVAGRVRGVGGEPVGGAEVWVLGTGRVVVADAEGRFVVRGLRAGEHRLHVSRLGYAPVAREVVVPGEGGGTAPTYVEIVLVETPLALPGVQVTATPGGGEAWAASQATTE